MENDAIRNRRVSSFPHRINSSARPRSSCPKHSAMNHDGPAFSSSSFRHAVLGAGRPCSSCGPNVMCAELGTCLPLSGSGFPELADGDGCSGGGSRTLTVSPYRTNSDVVCQPAPCRFGLRGRVPSGGTRIESNPGPSFKYRCPQTHSSKDT